MPPIAWSSYGELIYYSDIGALNATGAIGRTLPTYIVLAYYSSLSYMDHEMGRLITEVERLGDANNSIISFLGDHG